MPKRGLATRAEEVFDGAPVASADADGPPASGPGKRQRKAPVAFDPAPAKTKSFPAKKEPAKAPAKAPAKKAAAIAPAKKARTKQSLRAVAQTDLEEAEAGRSEGRVDRQGRPVKWLAQPGPKILERIERALPGAKNRMFLIEAEPPVPSGVEGGPLQQFKVLGASSSVYTVTIRTSPHCTCPDHGFNRPETGGLCKHILFVLMRVLKLQHNDPLLWQQALLAGEVEKLLGSATAGGTADAAAMAPEQVRQLFLRATGRQQPPAPAPGAAVASGALEPGQRPIEGDCPICFEEMEVDGREAFTWCASGCGNNFHATCFARWTAQKQSSGQQVTCVLCRQPWTAAGGVSAGGSGCYGGAGAGRARGAGWRGNINLSHFAQTLGSGSVDPVALVRGE